MRFAELLLAPIIGVRLRYRSKWEICSDYDPIFAFLLKHKGYLRKKIGATVFMAVTLKYFAYFGSDFTQIFTYFQIWLRFSSDFSRNSLVSRLCYCLSKSPDVETSMFKCHATRSYCKFFWLLVSKASP